MTRAGELPLGNPGFFLVVTIVCYAVGTFILPIQGTLACITGLLCLGLAAVSPVLGIAISTVRWKHLSQHAKIATSLLLAAALWMGATLIPAL